MIQKIIIATFLLFNIIMVSGQTISIRDSSGRTSKGYFEIRDQAFLYYSQNGQFLGKAIYDKTKLLMEYSDSGGTVVGKAKIDKNKIYYFNSEDIKVASGELLGNIIAYYDINGQRTSYGMTSNEMTIIKSADGELVSMIEATGAIWRPIPLIEADRIWGMNCIEMKIAGELKTEESSSREISSTQPQKLFNYIIVTSEILPGSNAEFSGLNVGDIWLKYQNWSLDSADMTTKGAMSGELGKIIKENTDQAHLYVYRPAANNHWEIVELNLPPGELGVTVSVESISEEDLSTFITACKKIQNHD